MRLFALLVAAAGVSGCGGSSTDADVPNPRFTTGRISDDDDLSSQFLTEATTNAQPGDIIRDLTFVDGDGKTVTPRSAANKKNLVLVFTRGSVYGGSVCPYCSSYASSLITNYKAIAERNAEVLLVYPIPTPKDTNRLSEFLKVTFRRAKTTGDRPPFPVVIDPQVAAVKKLGIERDLSKPATYILDGDGQVRFAYVGERLTDRPSIKVILKELDAIQRKAS